MIMDDIGVFAVAPKKDTIDTMITEETSIHVNNPREWKAVPMNAPRRPPITIEGPKTPALPPDPMVKEVAMILNTIIRPKKYNGKRVTPLSIAICNHP